MQIIHIIKKNSRNFLQLLKIKSKILINSRRLQNIYIHTDKDK